MLKNKENYTNDQLVGVLLSAMLKLSTGSNMMVSLNPYHEHGHFIRDLMIYLADVRFKDDLITDPQLLVRTLVAIKDFINFEHLKLIKQLKGNNIEGKVGVNRSDVLQIRPEARALYTVVAKSIILNFENLKFDHKC